MLSQDHPQISQPCVDALSAVLSSAIEYGYPNLSLPLPESDRSRKLIESLETLTNLKTRVDELKTRLSQLEFCEEARGVFYANDIENNLKSLKVFETHLSSISVNQDKLLHNLKKQVTGSFVTIEPKYQPDVATVFPAVAEIISQMESGIQNINMVGNNLQNIATTHDDINVENNMNNLLNEVPRVVALYSQLFDEIRGIRETLYTKNP